MRGWRAPNACAASGVTADIDPHAEHEHGEQHRVRERGRRNRLVAEPADQREIARHHGDLAKLRQRDRQRELDRLGQLGAPNRFARRRLAGG